MDKETKQFHTINLIYIVFLVIWHPIRLLFVQIDAKGRITLFFTLFVAIINFAFSPNVKKLMGSKPFIIWLIWILYAFVNMMIKGYHYEVNTPLFYFVNNLFAPYLAIVLTCHESLIDRKKLIRLLILVISFYCVLGFFFMGRSHTETNSSVSVGNMLAVNASLLVFLLCAARNEKMISKFVFSTLLVLCLLLIVSTATRKAFGAAVILIAFYGLSRISLKPQNIIFVVVLAIGGYFGVEYMLDNTYLGDRLASTSEQAVSRYEYVSDSKFLQFVGDRAPHYVYGWEIFKKSPVTGIGLCNFMHVSGFPERLHTDYMVQFAENGLIGVVLFVLYYLWFLGSLNKLRGVEDDKSKAIIGLGWIVAVLFLGLTSWTYETATVFICSGVTASYVFSSTKKEIAQ